MREQSALKMRGGVNILTDKLSESDLLLQASCAARRRISSLYVIVFLLIIGRVASVFLFRRSVLHELF